MYSMGIGKRNSNEEIKPQKSYRFQGATFSKKEPTSTKYILSRLTAMLLSSLHAYNGSQWNSEFVDFRCSPQTGRLFRLILDCYAIFQIWNLTGVKRETVLITVSLVGPCSSRYSLIWIVAHCQTIDSTCPCIHDCDVWSFMRFVHLWLI